VRLYQLLWQLLKHAFQGRRPIYYCRFAAPGSRRIRPGRWSWWITDGLTGPILTQGTACTEWGAHRALDRALRRCEMATGVCRCDRPVLAPLDPVTAKTLNVRLKAKGIPVTVQLPTEGVAVLWPAVALTTEQEMHTYALVTAETDMPMRWAGVA
jgi:hypothetical protein